MLAKKLNNHIEQRVDIERKEFRSSIRKPMSKITKYSVHDVGGEIIKDNETYVLKDNKTLKNLVLSSTMLRKGMSTRGHQHPGQEEVYFFVKGYGKMIVGDETDEAFNVGPGDIILIPDGAFHRVINDGDTHMLFNCVFDGNRNH